MQQELVLLIVTFPFFTSLALISCLKSHWKFKGENNHDSSDVYVKTNPPVLVQKSVDEPKKTEKKVKKPEVKDKKGKKLAKFFIFNGKEDSLKTPDLADLSLESTQNSDAEHESPLGSSYEFSGEERLNGLQLIPSPRPGYVEKLRERVRRARRGKKSPQDYYCSDEEDSLFNIPSLHDQATIKSSRTNYPLDIQDSRLLRVNQDRLNYKKSHTIYAPRPSTSPFSARTNNHISSASSDSATESEPTTIIQNL